MRPRKHGTYATYVALRCQCDPCGKAANAYRRRVRKLKAYGQWQPFLDAEPVRAHVNHLRAAGLGERSIAELADVSEMLIGRLIRGDRHRGTPPTKRLRPETAQRILAITPSLEVFSDHHQIDGTGSRRRLRALVAIGWTQQSLAERIGMYLSSLNKVVLGGGVTAGTARAVRALYDDLWNQVPAETTPKAATAAKRARNLAARRGWAPPLAWDEESIDDPAAEPQGAGYRPLQGKLPDADDLEHLVAGGDSAEVIADRYDVSVRYVRQRLNQKTGAAA